MKRRKIEPMIVTREDAMMKHDRIMLRIQWFALGIAATCLTLAFNLPGFLQTGISMFVVALLISGIRRWNRNFIARDTLREKSVPIILTGVPIKGK